MAKNFQFKLEIKLYSFVNRNTENSISYIRDIYTMNQCFVTSVTACLRRRMSEKIKKPHQKCQLNCKKMSIKLYRNCDETIMDVLLNVGPNWKRNDEEMIETFQS